eukprot:11228351-Lingulodinium_polyedra.AAC.1
MLCNKSQDIYLNPASIRNPGPCYKGLLILNPGSMKNQINNINNIDTHNPNDADDSSDSSDSIAEVFQG